jgi:excisionase family DNA binding protein
VSERTLIRTRGTAAGTSDWLTLGQAAEYLGVAQSTMRKWSDLGRLPAFYTPGGHRRYRRANLDAFLERSRPTKTKTGPDVLIVDDDPRLRRFLRENLELEGCLVREAGSAEEGLAALDEQPPDLILLDVMLPRIDGWEMLRRVQERHGIGSIPVLMFSGGVDEVSGSDAQRPRDVLGRPLDPQELIESAKQILPS